MGRSEITIILLAVAILASPMLTGKSWRQLADDVSDALSNFRRPGPPTHPLPGDDARILNRRAKR